MAEKSLNDKTMFSGFLFGIVMGSLWSLFCGPRLRFFLNLSKTREQIVDTAASVRGAILPADPIASSIEEGKQAARRRLSELTKAS